MGWFSSDDDTITPQEWAQEENLSDETAQMFADWCAEHGIEGLSGLNYYQAWNDFARDWYAATYPEGDETEG